MGIRSYLLQTAAEKWLNLVDTFQADRRGWLICTAVLLITVVRSGLTYSFGFFVVQLETYYHSSMAEQNWIGTLSFCISLSCSPLMVTFIRSLDYHAYRKVGLVGTFILGASCLSSSFVPALEWMFLTHSVMYGLGSSMIYMVSSLIIGEYFDKDHKYHVLATSLLLCGYPIGGLLFNPINAWLISRFGWHVAFRVTGALVLVTGVLCSASFAAKSSSSSSSSSPAAMNRLKEEKDEDDDDDDEDGACDVTVTRPDAEENRANYCCCCTAAEMRARPEIVLWFLGNCLSSMGFYMPFVNLPYYMQLKDIPATDSSVAVTLLSLAECMTYLIASYFGDYMKGSLIYVNAIAASALSVIYVTWPFVDVDYYVILVISAAMGGFLGLTIVYTYAASGEVTKLPMDVAWSYTNLYSGIGILLGPLFTGAVYDIRNTYMDVFIVVGAIYAFDAIVFAAIPFIKYRRRIRQRAEDAIKFSTFKVGLNGGSDAIVSEYGTVSSAPSPSADHVTQGRGPMEDGNAGKDES